MGKVNGKNEWWRVVTSWKESVGGEVIIF
jgi:hypothetical protein